MRADSIVEPWAALANVLAITFFAFSMASWGRSSYRTLRR
jgi:hypothetical protein